MKMLSLRAQQHKLFPLSHSSFKNFACTKCRKDNSTMHCCGKGKKGMPEHMMVYPAFLHCNTALTKCQQQG